MKYLMGLLFLTSTVAAQQPLHEGDYVRLRPGPEYRYRLNVGVVQATGPDSATVLFRNNCRDSEVRTISRTELSVRTAGGRLTIPYAITGAINAFILGKVAAHVIVHNGGGPEGARAARYGAALLIPFTAIKGYEKRTPSWVPVPAQTAGTEHLHVAAGDGYLDRMCSSRASPRG
jgi:hypothetical protein